MKDSAIEWTNHTFNPWWGCEKVAQGCRNCYAEGVATRFYGRNVWGPASKTERRIASEKVWNDPIRWNKAAERSGTRAKVFCLSMGDVLEDHPQLVEPRKRLVGVIEATPWLDWQLLTKRPENSAAFGWGYNWPANVWFGASAATHAEMYTNAPHLLGSHARLKFWSLEPLIGEVVMTPQCMGDWVIVGGESGPRARPCDVDWVRDIVSQCQREDVPVFVKQLGALSIWNGSGLIANNPPCSTHKDVVSGSEVRVLDTVDHKGGDQAEWPEDLRVREFPACAAVEGA